MGSPTRPDPAAVQVICLGLSRTGTTSLREALTILGLGPCYHMFDIIQGGGDDYPVWFKISDGLGTPADFDALFKDCRSVLDCPAAMFPAELYAAYPQAKYILTTRDPAKWEKSMEATLFKSIRALRVRSKKSPIEQSLETWNEKHMLTKFHRGRLFSHTQQELLDHNERVKQIIPSEKLLVYEVGEGWDRLVQFLGVTEPVTPFPHLNDAAQFQNIMIQTLGVSNIMDAPE